MSIRSGWLRVVTAAIKSVLTVGAMSLVVGVFVPYVVMAVVWGSSYAQSTSSNTLLLGYTWLAAAALGLVFLWPVAVFFFRRAGRQSTQAGVATAVDPSEPEYAGGLIRFGAMAIDAFIWLPLACLHLWAEKHFRLAQVYLLVPVAALWLCYSVYLVARFGGTPGKVLLKLAVTTTNGQPVSLLRALVRYLPQYVPFIAMQVALSVPLLDMSDARYREISGSLRERSHVLRADAPGWMHPVELGYEIFAAADILVLLANRRRRSVHDFIAGTVVVRRRRPANPAPVSADQPTAN